jgi:hypothetical protein
MRTPVTSASTITSGFTLRQTHVTLAIGIRTRPSIWTRGILARAGSATPVDLVVLDDTNLGGALFRGFATLTEGALNGHALRVLALRSVAAIRVYAAA